MTDETRQQIQDYIAYLLRNSSAERPMWNKEMIRENKPNKWNYIDGCMITALLSPIITTVLAFIFPIA